MGASLAHTSDVRMLVVLFQYIMNETYNSEKLSFLEIEYFNKVWLQVWRFDVF